MVQSSYDRVACSAFFHSVVLFGVIVYHPWWDIDQIAVHTFSTTINLLYYKSHLFRCVKILLFNTSFSGVLVDTLKMFFAFFYSEKSVVTFTALFQRAINKIWVNFFMVFKLIQICWAVVTVFAFKTATGGNNVIFMDHLMVPNPRTQFAAVKLL